MVAAKKNLGIYWPRLREAWELGNRDYVRVEMLVLSKRELMRLIHHVLTSGEDQEMEAQDQMLADILNYLEECHLNKIGV